MDSLSAKWASLGVAFYSSSLLASPEEALIDFLKSNEFPEDKKMLGIILMWLKNYSSLVHVERLKNMLNNLDAFQLAVLGGIAKKVTNFGDSRWKMIERFVQKKNTDTVSFKQGDSIAFIKLKSLDRDFASFGIKVALVAPEDDKKLLKRENVIRNNLWLKNRVLFGANVRADIATLIELKRIKNGYEAAKLAGCSMTAAYRNYSSLIEAGWPYRS